MQVTDVYSQLKRYKKQSEEETASPASDSVSADHRARSQIIFTY